MEDIIDKAKGFEYNANTSALLLDFKWILHNCTILKNKGIFLDVQLDVDSFIITFHNNISDKDQRQQYVDACDCAENLLRICIEEMSKLKYCGDCYKNVDQPKGITLVCPKPHLLLWAKFDLYPYWPAKLVSADSDSIYVHFFGDHTAEDIPYDNCYLYSEEDPNDEWCTTRPKRFFQKAVNVRIDFNPMEFCFI